MAVHAQFGGLLAGCLPPFFGGGLAGEQMRALRDSGALPPAAAGNKEYHYQYNCSAGVVSAAQSELTCNGSGGGGVPPRRKRGREDELGFEQYVASSSAAMLPIPRTQKVAVAQQQSPAAVANRTLDSALASTSGRPATTAAAAVENALVAELCRQQGAGIDALVRAECDRLRAGLERAQKRQCQALVRAAAAGASRLLRAKEAELDAARRRASILDERLRQAVAESQAWCSLARRNEAVAAGLRAALDTLLLGGAPAQPAEEGFGESDPADAVSCCIAEAEYAGARAATSSPPAASKGRACRACGDGGGGGEATVLVLPCRHLCLCKACEPRADVCPVCLAAKTASIHVAAE